MLQDGQPPFLLNHTAQRKTDREMEQEGEWKAEWDLMEEKLSQKGRKIDW